MFYRRYGKRAFDLVAATTTLIVLSPLIGALAVLIRVRLGSPVLFRQQRTGWKRQPFAIAKFRSMRDAHDTAGKALPDEVRLTPFGRWLRASSLDELPGLFNIVRGEMSIVGPRPLLHAYDPLFSNEQARRFDVRPGITGWAQINGRNAISWPEKFALDLWYAERVSFALDLRIVLRTAGRVFSRTDINADDAATMQAFRGETEMPLRDS